VAFFAHQPENDLPEKGRPGLAGLRLEGTGSCSPKRFFVVSFEYRYFRERAKFFFDTGRLRNPMLEIG
jgi:hypothetical protein